MFKNFFKILFSFFPRHEKPLSLGYRTVIENGDLILRKKFEVMTVSIHQGVEPFNSKFKNIIDFEIENACVIFDFSSSLDSDTLNEMTDKLRELFDFSYYRENSGRRLLFSMLRDMEFDDLRLDPIFKEIEAICHDS